MLALVITQFYNLTGMTGYAGISNIVAKGNVKRSMWVCMTTHTRSQLVVSFTFVALAAKWYDLLGCGGVSIVTILAADLGFMFATGCSDVCRRFAVTFGTIVIR